MNLIAYNLKSIIEEKKNSGMTIEQIANATVSKKTIYDIMAGRVVPRKGTIELLEQGLNLKAGDLSRSHAYFDSDYLLEQLNRVFKPVLVEEHPLYEASDYDGDLVYSTLEETLIIECGMDPDSLFKHIMPSYDVQKRVVEYFNSNYDDVSFTVDGLFKPINKLSFATAALRSSSLLNASKINVLSAVSLDKKKMMAMFNDINVEYQKVIYNMICDFYVLSHQHDFD